MTEETEPKSKKPRKPQPIRIAKSIEFLGVQPPEDMTSEREVLKWMGGGRVDPGKYSLIRMLEADAEVEAIPSTAYRVKTKK